MLGTLTRTRRSELAPHDARIVCHQRYDPVESGPGILTMNGRLYTYATSAVGWSLTECATGRVHNVTGRITLQGCSCDEYYLRHPSTGRKLGRCLHQLALIRCQRTFRVAGDEQELTFWRDEDADERDG